MVDPGRGTGDAERQGRGKGQLAPDVVKKSAYTFISVPTMHRVQSSRDICGLPPGTVSRDGGTVAAD